MVTADDMLIVPPVELERNAVVPGTALVCEILPMAPRLSALSDWKVRDVPEPEIAIAPELEKLEVVPFIEIDSVPEDKATLLPTDNAPLETVSCELLPRFSVDVAEPPELIKFKP